MHIPLLESTIESKETEIIRLNKIKHDQNKKIDEKKLITKMKDIELQKMKQTLSVVNLNKQQNDIVAISKPETDLPQTILK